MDGGATLYIAAAAAAASMAATGVSAYSQYQTTQQQAAVGERTASLNRQAALLQAETARVQREAMMTQVSQTELEAVEQENERQRRARGVESSNRALGALFGFDADTSGSFASLAAENRRLADNDIASIRLLGRARQVQFMGGATNQANQEWGLYNRAELAGIERGAYRTMGDNAWIAPTATLIGGASRAWSASPWAGTGTGSRS